MDDLQQRVRADLERVRRDEVRLVTQLERLRQDRTKLEAFLEVAARYDVTPGAKSEREQVPSSHAHNRGGGKSIKLVDMCVDMIRDAGRPMLISELAFGIERQGVEIGGARPVPNLAGYLSRSNKVLFKSGIGWRVVTDTASEPWMVSQFDLSEGPLATTDQDPEAAMAEDDAASAGSFQPKEGT